MNPWEEPNLFVKWKYATNDVRFSTPSPFPEQDYYRAPDALLLCSNSSGHFYDGYLQDEVYAYLREQVAILHFNNKNFDSDHIHYAITGRIFLWRGNQLFRNDRFYTDTSLPAIIKEVLSMGDKYIDLIENKLYTVHWYGDRILNLPPRERTGQWGERTKAKLEARLKHREEQVRDILTAAKDDFLKENFNVFPTIKHLSDVSGFSSYQIKKYGEGLFIKKAEYTKQMIISYKQQFSELSYRELSEISDISLTSFKRYHGGRF